MKRFEVIPTPGSYSGKSIKPFTDYTNASIKDEMAYLGKHILQTYGPDSKYPCRDIDVSVYSDKSNKRIAKYSVFVWNDGSIHYINDNTFSRRMYKVKVRV